MDESLVVRSPGEAFQVTLAGRRKMASWKPGIGYEHHRGTPFVYVGNNPYIAYYEYRLYEMTGQIEDNAGSTVRIRPLQGPADRVEQPRRLRGGERQAAEMAT